jgi:hypothetical protein
MIELIVLLVVGIVIPAIGFLFYLRSRRIRRLKAATRTADMASVSMQHMQAPGYVYLQQPSVVNYHATAPIQAMPDMINSQYMAAQYQYSQPAAPPVESMDAPPPKYEEMHVRP